MSHRLGSLLRGWAVLALLAQVHGCARAPDAPATATQTAESAADFPAELVDFVPGPNNPVFRAAGPGHWDAKIRERGWILREDDMYHMWYTGYDGTTDGIKLLGYATSPDGLEWTRYEGNPLVSDHWIEDMMVVKHEESYYMFAEGLHDRAQLLVSQDRVHWDRRGTLDVRDVGGKPLSAGPLGTPTAWIEDDTWHLLYERMDLGVWLATSQDLKTWTNVQDEPVMVPGPDGYDQRMIAVNQVVKHDGAYFAYYHGSGGRWTSRAWSTDVARSTDLLHWQKYSKNPLVAGDKSSGILVFDGEHYRLYTMHNAVEVYFPRAR